ncbi:hypothetical protein GIB67_006012 [Kingdonia uniflora]|uniref:Sm domain-containing protein n=1 Tax=Kingdonia uniflora TaxID=39325 RepID=A0A7J7MC95_9MAGN|nr:hypothetical protein GIB67_006012 [Kingdonia uniflora]
MSTHQVVQPRTSANVVGRRRGEREMSARLDSNVHTGRSISGSSSIAGPLKGGKVGGCGSLLRDRLVYFTTCLIGHVVEVEVKNGSIFSGIYHAANVEKDFGISLRMARLVKDVSFRGQNIVSEWASKPIPKTLVIPGKDIVQIIAKGAYVISEDESTNGLQYERDDIMIDSFISKSHYSEGRELKPWTPDEDDPQCPESENIFEDTWNRKWDQFEINETLFGVKSTFNEELYTTKLVKGPQTRALEREATRIAKEMEGEETQDIHLAEERGIHLPGDIDVDEETRYSSVFRGVDDRGYGEDEDIMLDSHNTETFGDSSGSVISKSFLNVARGKSDDRAQASSTSSSMVVSWDLFMFYMHFENKDHCLKSNYGDDMQFSQFNALHRSGSSDHARQLEGEIRMNENLIREQHVERISVEEVTKRKTVIQETQTQKVKDIQASHNLKKSTSDKVGLSHSATSLSPSATSYSPSPCVTSKDHDEHTNYSGESSDGAGSGKPHRATEPVNPRGRPGSSASSTSERAGAAPASTNPGLSPSSSMGSLSSEKSTLNPYAKEFKFNPNAKSFSPVQTILRPPSPVSDGSYYMPAGMSAVQHMHGVPVGMGVGPSFGGPQPVIYNPQIAPMQPPHAYIHPNGPPLYQQMILGQPRQVMYMPSYPPMFNLSNTVEAASRLRQNG